VTRDDARRVVVTGATFPHAVSTELEAGGFSILSLPGDLSEAEVVEHLQGAWGYVLGGAERMTRSAWAKVPTLKVACFLGTGYSSFMELPDDPMDLTFAYTPHANAGAVAEFAIAQMLDIVRGVTRRVAQVQRGHWSEDATPSLVGARLGVAGMGHIGREVARMASAGFDMEVFYWNRTRRAELDALHYKMVPSLLELCEAVDVLAVCFAHEPGQNDGAIAEKELQALGVDGFLVNATRAALVDPASLRTALEQDWIAGASIDGYYVEPSPSVDQDPYGLLRLVPEKLLVTPHCAYLSTQAVRRMADMAAENLLAVGRGSVPPYAIAQ
jgi:phosphoglycerate dehydrogenase-like enzyme